MQQQTAACYSPCLITAPVPWSVQTPTRDAHIDPPLRQTNPGTAAVLATGAEDLPPDLVALEAMRAPEHSPQMRESSAHIPLADTPDCHGWAKVRQFGESPVPGGSCWSSFARCAVPPLGTRPRIRQKTPRSHVRSCKTVLATDRLMRVSAEVTEVGHGSSQDATAMPMTSSNLALHGKRLHPRWRHARFAPALRCSSKPLVPSLFVGLGSEQTHRHCAFSFRRRPWTQSVFLRGFGEVARADS